MENPQRRVHRLRINSQDKDNVSSEVHALQDAFNIASLPGLPPQGLFLIKKLDLGRYPSQSTSLNISRLIDQRVQALGYQSRCVDDGDHPQQNLVWFSDSVQAVFCLVKSIVQNGSAQAWYWRTLFPSWRPEMGLAESLIAISRDYPEQQSKPFVFAQVIEQMLLHSNLDTILVAVTTELAHQQLTGTGLYPCLVAENKKRPAPSSNFTPIISTSWQVLLQRAITDWGERDVRSVWIAFSALILHNPAVIESAVLQPMITSIIKNNSVRLETVETDPEKPEIISPGLETSSATTKPVFDDRASGRSRPIQAISFAESETTHVVKDRPAQKANHSVVENNSIRLIDQNTFTGFEHADNCGLAFIIPLLEWLSMKELLSLNPEMAALNLPVRVIHAIVQRFGIADTHRVLQAMPAPTEAGSDEIENFLCPPGWQLLINSVTPEVADKRLYRFQIKDSNSECYITDRSKKLLLYVGNSNLPDWMASYRILDQAGSQACPILADLRNTIQLLASRYLYRYAKISLRDLVNRRGQIASSNTHLDILFDSQQIDIRIRIAGLDINPGWVPWCARVVQFHYSDGGPSHA